MLLKGRVDVYLEGELLLMYVLRSLGAMDDVVIAGYTNEAFDDYVAFSPKRQKAAELAALMTKTIVYLKESGRLRDFLAPYIGGYSLEH